MKSLKSGKFTELSWTNGSSWGRLSSDGYYEEYGRVDFPETKLTYTKVITFKIPYKNINYKVFSQVIEGGIYWALSQSNCRNRTVTGFTLEFYAADHNGSRAGNVLPHSYNWGTKGYVDLEDPVVKKFIEEHQ